MIFIPVINDISHAHLTKEDWESLAFTQVAIDVIQLFLHPYWVIPESVKTVFLNTQVRACHKVSKQKHLSGAFFLYSPRNGQKVLITSEEIQAKIDLFKKKLETCKDVEVIVISSHSDPEYHFSDMPGIDGEKGLLYSNKETIAIQDEKWANVFEPIDDNCGCYTCRHFTLAYLHHLHNVGVPLGMRLGILHNLSCHAVKIK